MPQQLLGHPEPFDNVRLSDLGTRAVQRDEHGSQHQSPHVRVDRPSVGSRSTGGCHSGFQPAHGQLSEIAAEIGIRAEAISSEPTNSAKTQQKLDTAAYENLHKALLCGLIGNLGMKSTEGDDYLSARGSHFWIFPGSGLKKSRPKWLVAAELVETSRLYARSVARVEPEWVEKLAPHLVKYHYFDPHWEKSRGEVMASERVTLFSLTLIARRAVSYGRIAPQEARELFIRGALVTMEYGSQAPFFQHNQQLIREVEQLEHKSRRQDVLVDEEVLFGFFNQRLPAEVVDAASFEAWRKQAEHEERTLLFLTREELMRHVLRRFVLGYGILAAEICVPAALLADGSWHL